MWKTGCPGVLHGAKWWRETVRLNVETEDENLVVHNSFVPIGRYAAGVAYARRAIRRRGSCASAPFSHGQPAPGIFFTIADAGRAMSFLIAILDFRSPRWPRFVPLKNEIQRLAVGIGRPPYLLSSRLRTLRSASRRSVIRR